MVWRARASILTKASSWRHERANFRPDIYFSNTRFRRIFFCFSFAESSARKHRQVYIELLIISEAFSFPPLCCHFRSAFSFLSGKITEFMRFIPQPALIIAHGTVARLVDESCAQNFFQFMSEHKGWYMRCYARRQARSWRWATWFQSKLMCHK